jgi:hypothetical protein
VPDLTSGAESNLTMAVVAGDASPEGTHAAPSRPSRAMRSWASSAGAAWAWSTAPARSS